MTEVSSLTGRLLVATPVLADPNFDRAVVLLLDHDEEGSLGVVLNRPTPVDVSDILEPWAALTGEPGVVFQGGPVSLDAALGVAVVPSGRGDRTDGDTSRTPGRGSGQAPGQPSGPASGRKRTIPAEGPTDATESSESAGRGEERAGREGPGDASRGTARSEARAGGDDGDDGAGTPGAEPGAAGAAGAAGADGTTGAAGTTGTTGTTGAPERGGAEPAGADAAQRGSAAGRKDGPGEGAAVGDAEAAADGGDADPTGAEADADLGTDTVLDTDGPLGWRRVHGAIGLVDLEAPPELLAAELGSLRIFAGYSGWGPGQLEKELSEGAWYVVESEPGDVSSPAPERLWRSVLRRQRSELALVATYPDDPSLN
ncbi:hypothetical protein HC362_20765 [Streptomyces sp. 891-h]|nr:hypothetical protein HC362_20765 [Streptomyces sp. 891-h]